MTRRLYYDDAHTLDFNAEVVERLDWEGHPAIVLEKTYFYPTGGGQPHDTGVLNDVDVVDVQSRKTDGAVIHVLAQPLGDDVDMVEAHIDGERRLHHMRHHTGQHILTQAFVQTANLNTVSFHLGTESITIDLDAPDVNEVQIHTAEELTNTIIRENRPVEASVIDPSEADDVRMRKMPDTLLTEGLRVIEVADFDRTACGGTHVAHTGEIGLLKIVKTEKRGSNTRIEFRCGQLALDDYRHKHTLLDALSNQLTCGIDDLPDIVTKLQDDLQQATKALSTAQEVLVGYEAEKLLADAGPLDEGQLVMHIDQSGGDIRALASKLVEAPQTVVLLAGLGDSLQLIAARSSDLDYDARQLLATMTEYLEGARGGGRPVFAQGGGPAVSFEAVATALELARQNL